MAVYKKHGFGGRAGDASPALVERRDYVGKKYLTCVDCHEKFFDPHLYECPKCNGILQVGYEADGEFAARNAEDGGVAGNGKIVRGGSAVSFSSLCDEEYPGMWRYKTFLPVEDKKNIVTLGEGMTALVRAGRMYRELGIENLYIKNEFSNPTASFKDRPTSVGISVAKECGADTVAVASTGNAGVAVAAYAAKAGMKSIVCAPSDTAEGKIAQLLAYGANIFYVDGNYSDCFGMVKEACGEYGYVNLTSTYVNPYTVEAANCSPIAKAFYSCREVRSEPETEYTIAGGIADQLVGYEKDGEFTIRQIRESGGDCIMLTEEELFECWHELCFREGVFSEPAGAAAVGAVKKLRQNPAFHEDDLIVSLVTAHGLKYPDLPNRLQSKAVVVTNAKELKI